MTYKGARKGPILVKGCDRENLERNIRTVQKTLKIEVKTMKDEMKGIIWE